MATFSDMRHVIEQHAERTSVILANRPELAKDQELFDEIYELIGCSLTNLDRVLGEAGFRRVLTEEMHSNKKAYPTDDGDYRRMDEEARFRTELN